MLRLCWWDLNSHLGLNELNLESSGIVRRFSDQHIWNLLRLRSRFLNPKIQLIDFFYTFETVLYPEVLWISGLWYFIPFGLLELLHNSRSRNYWNFCWLLRCLKFSTISWRSRIFPDQCYKLFTILWFPIEILRFILKIFSSKAPRCTTFDLWSRS